MIPIGRRFALVAAVVLLTGCLRGAGGGALEVRSLTDEPVRLQSSFSHAFYLHERLGESSFVLSDVAPDALTGELVENGQVLHIGLMWNPEPGKTPMDATATNVTIRFVLISGGELGVYGGGGFAMFSGSLGDSSVRVEIRDSSLRLLESTPGFHDALGPASVTGSFTAELDPDHARQVRFGISQIATNAIGRSIMVRSDHNSAGG